MLIKLRILLASLIIILSIYGLITDRFIFQSSMPLLLALLMSVIAGEEFKKGRKRAGYLSVAVSIFATIVWIQVLLYK